MPNQSTPDRPDTDRRRYRRYTRAVHQAGQLRPVTAAISYARSRLDPILYRATRGRLTLTGPSQPTMLLTTRNRTTGQPHTDPVSYQPDGDNLIAAYDNHDPATPDNWPANLHTDPHATIQIGTTTASYRARPATPAETDHATPRPPTLRPTRHPHPQPPATTRHAYTFEPLHGPPQRPTATGIQWLPPQNPEHTQNR